MTELDSKHPKVTVRHVSNAMGKLAPLSLAESWDNVGLLLGDYEHSVERIMTCLTVTEQTVREALLRSPDLIVSHHPIPFRPLQRITTDDPTGRWLWMLAGSGVSVYSPHTAWDNAASGINQTLAELLGLTQVQPLVIKPGINSSTESILGTGRVGILARPSLWEDLVELLRTSLGVLSLQFSGDATRRIRKLAIVCGSGASLLREASKAECDGFLTGEATYHQTLEATHLGINLIQVGHHASERFAMDRLAKELQSLFPTVECWASTEEADPIVGWVRA